MVVPPRHRWSAAACVPVSSTGPPDTRRRPDRVIDQASSMPLERQSPRKKKFTARAQRTQVQGREGWLDQARLRRSHSDHRGQIPPSFRDHSIVAGLLCRAFAQPMLVGRVGRRVWASPVITRGFLTVVDSIEGLLSIAKKLGSCRGSGAPLRGCTENLGGLSTSGSSRRRGPPTSPTRSGTKPSPRSPPARLTEPTTTRSRAGIGVLEPLLTRQAVDQRRVDLRNSAQARSSCGSRRQIKRLGRVRGDSVIPSPPEKNTSEGREPEGDFRR
jgi:hypothetical protein